MEIFISKASANSVSVDLVGGAAGEMHHILQTNLIPTVKAAKSAIDGAVKKTSAKLKAWAIEHLVMAQKLGRRTDLFEKLINNPNQAAEQLAMRLLLGAEAHRHTAALQERHAEEKEMKQMDDILGNLTFD